MPFRPKGQKSECGMRNAQHALPKTIIKTLSLFSLPSSWIARTLTTSNSCGEVTHRLGAYATCTTLLAARLIALVDQHDFSVIDSRFHSAVGLGSLFEGKRAIDRNF